MITSAGPALTLQQAEAYAVNHAPELQSLTAKANAEANKAIADGQLQDPKLTLGVSNIPTDSFSFSQENMTQVQVGIFQQLPKGDSLNLTMEKGQLNSQVTKQIKKLERLKIKKEIRQEWLQLCYLKDVIKLYEQQKDMFSHWEHVVKSKLKSGEARQNDIVRAKLEVNKLQQRIFQAKQEQAVVKEKLNRWLDSKKIKLVLPILPTPISEKSILRELKKHPLLVKDSLKSQAAMTGIKLSEQKYKPGVGVGVVYGFRQGDDSSGQERSDFVGAQISMDIPLFTQNRQDKTVKASQDLYVLSQESEVSDFRYLKSQLKQSYANWKSLIEEKNLYQNELLQQANYYTQSTEIAYQNQQTDFLTLVRAYIEQYQIQVEALKIEIQEKQEQVNLLFLQGR